MKGSNAASAQVVLYLLVLCSSVECTITPRQAEGHPCQPVPSPRFSHAALLSRRGAMTQRRDNDMWSTGVTDEV
ncbi:hypothetical protein GE09DRAFT_303195 [Coniochaeta sp. 2T2.1]|nr:hypothetical protein GE09DRAFT_303195 [Coniochaeta sp. 2T2.1]